MYHHNLMFAEASHSYENAKFVIMGVGFDRTSSFRVGQRFGPNAIREATWNFETWMFEHLLDLKDVPIHDLGNLDEAGKVEDMLADVADVSKKVLDDGKFLLTIGGEHSISPGIVRHFGKPEKLSAAAKKSLFGKEKLTDRDGIGVIVVDAHLDGKDEYLGDKWSHACASRRMADAVGSEHLVVIGVRSIAKGEFEEAKKSGLRFISAYDVKRDGIEASVKRALEMIGRERIYLSIDIDGIDPAFAPGVATPEPFGLTPDDLKRLINSLGGRLVGADVMELTPPMDPSGITAALVARIAREIIAVKWISARGGR